MRGENETPTPEELSKKLEEFLKKNFGNNAAVSFTSFPPGTEPMEPEESEPEETEIEPLSDDIFEFNYRPRDIKAHLDRFVIRQDEAKKVLSIAVCDHYNHVKYLRQMDGKDSVEFTKQNVIIVGPTGVGKTYLVKHIAELIGVPFVKADATKFSETGYVGGDVDDLIRELVSKANGDIERAQYGIVYIDEVDKLASRGDMLGRDVSGRGVQTTLLKLMEETEVSLRSPMDFHSQMQAVFGSSGGRDMINTRHILFIVSGAFQGLEKIVRKRMKSSSIGFGADPTEVPMDTELFKEVGTQDFIDYGFEAEFIGRLPVRVVCEDLSANDLFDIMKNSEGSLIRQYEREFEAYGIQSAFKEDALRKIAELAANEKTGARGLMTVCERLLRDFKFELPGTSITEFTVDAELIEQPGKALEHYREIGSKVNEQKVEHELKAFAKEFQNKHQVKIEFDSGAVLEVGKLSLERNMSPMQLCSALFKDYQFGLKLIQKNIGCTSFTLTEDAVKDPDKFLSELVVESYRCRNPEEPKTEEKPQEEAAEASMDDVEEVDFEIDSETESA